MTAPQHNPYGTQNRAPQLRQERMNGDGLLAKGEHVEQVEQVYMDESLREFTSPGAKRGDGFFVSCMAVTNT